MAAKKKNSALLKAVRAGSLEDVQSLLAEGADPNVGSPLRAACKHVHVEIAAALLSAGADPNHASKAYPATALACACDNRDKSSARLALVRLLLEGGADPNTFPEDRDGPLHYAAMYCLPRVAAALLDAGADANRAGGYGRAPLAYAASSGVVATVEDVLAAGADPNLTNTGGENALFELISSPEPSLECAQLLIDAGLDLESTDHYKDTPLALAASVGHNGLVELFLGLGCSIDQAGSFGKAPVLRALAEKKFDTVELLLERGADPETRGLMTTAARVGAKDLVARLLKQVKSVDPEALFQAARSGDAETVGALLDSGVAVDARGYGETALMKAAAKGRVDVVQLLIDRGADLEARDGRGNTPLLHAAFSGRLETIKALVAAGALVGAQNSLNWNGLMQATVACHLPTVRYFVEQGVKLDEIDQEFGYTVLMLARARSAISIVEFLLEAGAEERPLRLPPEGQTVSLAECDVCTWLPDKRDMGKTESPEPLPYLIEVHRSVEYPDRHGAATRILFRCPICATHYEHCHSIDTEDAFVTGPWISQVLKRLSSEQLEARLKEIG